MGGTTNPEGIHTGVMSHVPITTAPATGESRRSSRIRRIGGIILWLIGAIILAVACVIVHSHPGPWPVDLETTRYVQGLHLWPWAMSAVLFVNVFNNGIPATIEVVAWFIVLLLFRKFRYAIFSGIGTGLSDGLNGLLSTVVARPRPDPHLVHVYMPEPFHSFPSGHVEHCVVFYGFLLYLSFTSPVRRWRYRWLLLPFQIFAILTILIVGYARVEAGSHWVTDSVAGYLSGALLLSLLIFLYRWTSARLARRRAGERVEIA